MDLKMGNATIIFCWKYVTPTSGRTKTIVRGILNHISTTFPLAWLIESQVQARSDCHSCMYIVVPQEHTYVDTHLSEFVAGRSQYSHSAIAPEASDCIEHNLSGVAGFSGQHKVYLTFPL